MRMILLAILAMMSIYVSSYILLPIQCNLPKIITPCDGIDQTVLKTSLEVAQSLRNVDIPFYFGKSINSTGFLCDKYLSTGFGYMSSYIESDVTNITISTVLKDYPNVLYNVILHEVLHSLGLNHDGEDGLMSYVVRTSYNWFMNRPVEDERKLWLSINNFEGILESCFNKEFNNI